MSLLYALTQAVVASAPEAAATQGVIAYPPAFFAAARPVNAREMLDRIPGFVFNGGDGVRGYEGAAGNVLIDGQRPASKSDNLDDILRRTPASKVARIELIRGGAPGIDHHRHAAGPHHQESGTRNGDVRQRRGELEVAGLHCDIR